MNNNIIEPLLSNFDKNNNNTYTFIDDTDDMSDYYVSIDDDTVYYTSSIKNRKKLNKQKSLIYKFNLNDRGKKVKRIVI